MERKWTLGPEHQGKAGSAKLGQGGGSLGHQSAVVVAMILMRMMEMAFHQVARVIAVGYGFVAAALAMPVGRRMCAAIVFRSTGLRIDFANFQAVLVDVIAVLGVEMPVVQVIRVVAVANGEVSAALTVNMSVGLVNRTTPGLHPLLW